MVKPNNSILQKYLENTCSESERQLVDAWYAQLSHNDSIRHFDSDKEYRQALHTLLWQEVQQASLETPARKIFLNNKYWAAAAILVFVTVGYFVYYRQAPKVSPGLAQSLDTINAPLAQVTSVQLPDGSIAWLKPGSRLVIPPRFTASTREIELLHGEIFLEVSADPSKPFLLTAGKNKVEVLGTSFNTKYGYAGQEDAVAVVSGKVRVRFGQRSLVDLGTGKTAVLSKSGNIELKNIQDFPAVAAWHSGEMVYQQETFANIVTNLQAFYGVKIHFRRPATSQNRVTGKFRYEQSVDDILHEICLVHGNTYTKDSEGQYWIE